MIRTHDRMPLILEEEQMKDWVFCREMAEEILRWVPVLLEKRMEYKQRSLLFE